MPLSDQSCRDGALLMGPRSTAQCSLQHSYYERHLPQRIMFQVTEIVGFMLSRAPSSFS
jgi:hypothetical protein